jgi:acyl carrier protein
MKERKDVSRLIELIIAEFDDLAPASISANTVYKELVHWNSINSVVLSVVIEAEFGVFLEKEDYRQTETISELMELIHERIGQIE